MSDTQTRRAGTASGRRLTDVQMLDPRMLMPDLDDAGLALVLAVPVNCVETMALAGTLRYHERGPGDRKKRRYTPADVDFNREVIGLVQPHIEVPVVDTATVTPQQVARGLARLEAA